MTFFDRVGYIEVEDRNHNMIRYGDESSSTFDFKFSMELAGDVYSKFNVSILGLSSTTINDLTVWDPSEFIENRRRIRVYAGYVSTGGARLVASGYVFTAIPTDPPERWLEISCLSLMDDNIPVDAPVVLNDVTVEDVVSAVADELKCTWEWNVTTVDLGKKIGSFSIDGNKLDLCNKLANTFDIIVYFEDGCIICVDKKPQYNEPKDATILDLDTGLIGVGRIDVAGAVFRARLSNRFRAFGWVQFESAVNPKYNGMYITVCKKITCHLRGEEWYIELDTLRWRMR